MTCAGGQHGFEWAVDRLREGYKVTRSCGLKGGRRFYKSVEQTWRLASVDDCMATDWVLYVRAA